MCSVSEIVSDLAPLSQGQWYVVASDGLDVECARALCEAAVAARLEARGVRLWWVVRCANDTVAPDVGRVDCAGVGSAEKLQQALSSAWPEPVSGFALRHVGPLSLLVLRGGAELWDELEVPGGIDRYWHGSTNVPEGFATRWPVKSRARREPLRVVGAGLAGASLVRAFGRRGHEITVVTRDMPATRTSGMPRGILQPTFQRPGEISGDLARSGYLYSHHLLTGKDCTLWHATGSIHLWPHAKIARRAQRGLQQMGWPESLVRIVSKEQASEIAGVALAHEGVYWPRAGWVCIPELVRDWLRGASLEIGEAIEGDVEIANDSRPILWACGIDGAGCDALGRVLQPDRGQIAVLPALPSTEVKCVVHGEAYLFPPHNKRQVLGSTSRIGETDVIFRWADHHDLIERCGRDLSQSDLSLWQQGGAMGRAALRARFEDLLPAACWIQRESSPQAVLNGLGSRGLALAPLLAELLASQWSGEPWPLPRNWAKAVGVCG